mgnify:CR=1 FL=1
MTLSAEESHYLIRVRRVRPGDALEVLEPSGGGWHSTLEVADVKRARVHLHSRLAPRPALALDLAVVELGYNDDPAAFAADIDAMMTALTAAVFDADLSGDVNGFRQNLQSEYVGRLAAMIGPGERLVVRYRTQLDADTQDGVALTNVAGAVEWFNGLCTLVFFLMLTYLSWKLALHSIDKGNVMSGVVRISAQLAWRNLWRNHRRSAIMLMSIALAVWAMIFMNALMRGMTDQMVRNGLAVWAPAHRAAARPRAHRRPRHRPAARWDARARHRPRWCR